MKHRPLVNHGVIEFFDFGLAASAAGRQWDLALLGLSIDKQPVRSLADIAALAADQGKAKERLFPLPRREVAELAFALPAETHPFFELFFLLGAMHLAQPSSHRQICLRIPVLPALSDPIKKLRGI